jgi:hypothetical protein
LQEIALPAFFFATTRAIAFAVLFAGLLEVVTNDTHCVVSRTAFQAVVLIYS